MISICVTTKNRSRVQAAGRDLLLFPNCVESIVQASIGHSELELVVSDWGSNDWPLQDWLWKTAAAVPTRVIPVQGDFCRGTGRNIAAQHASGEVLFFLDADCLISQHVLATGQHCIEGGKSFFPVLFSFDSPEHTTGWWRHEGFGNCMLRREVYAAAKGWPEYVRWGKEDDDFYTRVANQTEIVREEVPGFFHQWHPEDIAWKDRLVDDVEMNRVRDALGAIWNCVPPGETLILIDGGEFGGHEKGAGRRVLPFTENDGVYWGPPADGIHAIHELDRLVSQGAAYIAFVWPAFWWLDYYPELRERLETHSESCLESESVRLFRLSST